jgi:hypothetical protein
MAKGKGKGKNIGDNIVQGIFVSGIMVGVVTVCAIFGAIKVFNMFEISWKNNLLNYSINNSIIQ